VAAIMSSKNNHTKGYPSQPGTIAEPVSPFLNEQLFSDAELKESETLNARSDVFQPESLFVTAFEKSVSDDLDESKIGEIEEFEGYIDSDNFDKEFEEEYQDERIDEYEFNDELHGDEFDQELEEEANLIQDFGGEEDEEVDTELKDELSFPPGANRQSDWIAEESFVEEQIPKSRLKRREVAVGERIVLDLKNVPLASLILDVRWSVPGNAVKFYWGNRHKAKVTKLRKVDLKKTRLILHWVDAAQNREVRARVTWKFFGTQRRRDYIFPFDVKAPSLDHFRAKTDAPRITKERRLMVLRFGQLSGEPGIDWDWQVTMPAKHGGWVRDLQTVQIRRDKVQLLRRGRRTTRKLTWKHPNMDRHWQLDQDFADEGTEATYSAPGFYLPIKFPAKVGAGKTFQNNATFDSPADSLWPLDVRHFVHDAFNYYILYKADKQGAIWVPIAKAEWFWKAEAVKRRSRWRLKLKDGGVSSKGAATSEFPIYESNVNKNEYIEVDKFLDELDKEAFDVPYEELVGKVTKQELLANEMGEEEELYGKEIDELNDELHAESLGEEIEEPETEDFAGDGEFEAAASRQKQARPDLGSSAEQVTAYDWAFQGEKGERFKKLVEWAAIKVDINPGLLAVNLIAETRRSTYLKKGKVSTFLIGTDDFYDKRHDISRKIFAYSNIRWDKKQKPVIDINERGRRVKSIFFDSGRDALLASTVYLKHGEVLLRQVATEAGKDFNKLPLETRFALIRLAFNAGHGRARKNLQQALNGKDILIRKRKTKAGPQRKATIHAARAIHLSEHVFDIPTNAMIEPEIDDEEISDRDRYL
jgi:hypothetical protein